LEFFAARDDFARQQCRRRKNSAEDFLRLLRLFAAIALPGIFCGSRLFSRLQGFRLSAGMAQSLRSCMRAPTVLMGIVGQSG